MRNKIEIAAKQAGKTPTDLLISLFEIHGSQREVAKAIGVKQPSISLAITKYGLTQKTIITHRRDIA